MNFTKVLLIGYCIAIVDTYGATKKLVSGCFVHLWWSAAMIMMIVGNHKISSHYPGYKVICIKLSYSLMM